MFASGFFTGAIFMLLVTMAIGRYANWKSRK